MGNTGETSKLDYVADFMEHFIEQTSIRALNHSQVEERTFRFEPVNSLVEQQLSSIKSQKFCGRDVTFKDKEEYIL